MLKSKKKKDDQSPSKKALSSDYDGDQAINSSEAETSPGSEDKGLDHVISTGRQMTNFLSNFEYLLILCFLNVAEF